LSETDFVGWSGSAAICLYQTGYAPAKALSVSGLWRSGAGVSVRYSVNRVADTVLGAKNI
jgi:hypothetical protein